MRFMAELDLRRRLADYFRREAEWRWSKAEEHHDDRRNERCAKALQELASFVETLPENDGRLLLLRGLDQGPEDIWTPWGDAAKEASRFRFNDPNEECDEFFSRFVDAEIRGHGEAIKEGRVPPA